jgi:hypothetical protein
VSKGQGAQFVVLCEDKQAQVFVRRALIQAGANQRRIRLVALPSIIKGGAGHAYVVKHYPEEVKAFRTQQAKASTCLVVHLDADDRSVAERHSWLADSLKKAGGSPREKAEPIIELVPKRNIETWIYALDPKLPAGPLTEEEPLPKFKDAESKCVPAAAAFAGHAQNHTVPARAEAVPSLLDGLVEFRRLPR